MKISITKEFKRVCTVDLLPQVKKVIDSLKEDTGLKDYGSMAVALASGENSSCFEILKISAEICLNRRVWDRYTDDSKSLDIWIKVYAYNFYYGFYDIGVCLSDLWEITGKQDNDQKIKNHMYIKHYTQNK